MSFEIFWNVSLVPCFRYWYFWLCGMLNVRLFFLQVRLEYSYNTKCKKLKYDTSAKEPFLDIHLPLCPLLILNNIPSKLQLSECNPSTPIMGPVKPTNPIPPYIHQLDRSIESLHTDASAYCYFILLAYTWWYFYNRIACNSQKQIKNYSDVLNNTSVDKCAL